ncbi:Fanconi anemia group F protein [Misgurnus anguillicaudatus]|uniref:Fanconi anemia group F protein n=1 Tax=Misgurnus anguillicaudatus TaxID=75329 RepID=UPI003CCF1457
MDSVLVNLQHVVELLAVSQTNSVNEWDHHTVLRAFKWAQFCEQLHALSRSNPPLRSALQSRLHDTNQLLQEISPSYSPVTLSGLAQCQHNLLINLLRNPSAPCFIVQMFFPNPKTATHGLEMDQTRLITCKSALKLLCRSLDRTSCAELKVESEVKGRLLRKHLDSVVSLGDNYVAARSLLDSILRDSAGKIDSLYDVIVGALIVKDDETNNDTCHVILDWLQDHDGCLGKLCRWMSPGLCSVLSGESVTFKRGYWDALKQWASGLEYDVMQSAWVPTCSVTSEEPVTFIVLFDRFGALLQSGSPLKEETMTKLLELKLESGDFDVKGVSVWTDLIIQLKMLK